MPELFGFPFPVILRPPGGGSSSTGPQLPQSVSGTRARFDQLVASGVIKPIAQAPQPPAPPPPAVPDAPGPAVPEPIVAFAPPMMPGGATQYAPTYPGDQPRTRPKPKRKPKPRVRVPGEIGLRGAARLLGGFLAFILEPMPSGGGDFRHEPIPPRKPPRTPPIRTSPEEVEFPDWDDIANRPYTPPPKPRVTPQPVVPGYEQLPTAPEVFDEPGLEPEPGLHSDPAPGPKPDQRSEPRSPGDPRSDPAPRPTRGPTRRPTPRPNPFDLLPFAFPIGPRVAPRAPRAPSRRPTLPRPEFVPDPGTEGIPEPFSQPGFPPAGVTTDACQCDAPRKKRKKRPPRDVCFKYTVRQKRKGQQTYARELIECE